MKKISINFAFSRRRKGVALILVISVMAIAAILGYAMLASSTLQGTASSNGINAAVADAQAESGIHLALYYLQNPSNAPTGFTSGSPLATTFAATGQSALPGSVTLTVVKPSGSTNVYNVTSVGSSQGSTTGGGSISRTITAVVQVNMVYLINQAVGSNSAITVPNGGTFSSAGTAISSSSNSNVTISAGGTVTGNISAKGVTGAGTHTGSTSVAPANPASPTSGNLNYYPTYTYNGTTYTAQALASASLSNTTLQPDPVLNPLGVFYYTGNVGIASNVTINGTLVVKNGKLAITGTNNTINAQTNMPAVLVDNTINFSSGKALSVNGVAWTGKGVVGAASANFQVSGALLIDTGGITGSWGTLKVTYNSALTSIPNLSSANLTPQSVQITGWSQ